MIYVCLAIVLIIGMMLMWNNRRFSKTSEAIYATSGLVFVLFAVVLFLKSIYF